MLIWLIFKCDSGIECTASGTLHEKRNIRKNPLPVHHLCLIPICMPTETWEYRSGWMNSRSCPPLVLVGIWPLQPRFESLSHHKERTFQKGTTSCSPGLPWSGGWQEDYRPVLSQRIAFFASFNRRITVRSGVLCSTVIDISQISELFVILKHSDWVNEWESYFCSGDSDEDACCFTSWLFRW